MTDIINDQSVRMLIFIFVGILFAMFVMGMHASPQVSPELGGTELKTLANQTPTPTTQEPYVSDSY